jgi:ATP-dependent Clp protease ATP-binding subunit ClpC
MFERYADPAKRAIFFARAMTILNDAPVIDSVHLLLGLIWGKDSRADALFHLREQFPVYTACPHKFASYQAAAGSVREGPALAHDAKRCVARAASEADVLRDYWIDTEHLLLGILGERSSVAAQYLSKAGLELRGARQVVIENKSSRPEYGPVPLRWRLGSPLEWLMFKLGLWKYLR